MCSSDLGASVPVLELAATGPTLAEALGVVPLWSAPVGADGAGRDRLRQTLDLLRIDRMRPDQDPRVRTRPRKGLLPQ